MDTNFPASDGIWLLETKARLTVALIRMTTGMGFKEFVVVLQQPNYGLSA